MMSSDRSTLSITLPAKAENVAIVRHALAGLAEELGMREPAIGDLKTVVTEACMNIVSHAYDNSPGPLHVEALPRWGELTVCVRDFGAGIRPRTDLEGSSLRLGLALIAALSDSFEIRGELGAGTEVRMRLSLS
jgi:serine/threonine-protein kinase RsbW